MEKIIISVRVKVIIECSTVGSMLKYQIIPGDLYYGYKCGKCNESEELYRCKLNLAEMVILALYLMTRNSNECITFDSIK